VVDGCEIRTLYQVQVILSCSNHRVLAERCERTNVENSPRDYTEGSPRWENDALCTNFYFGVAVGSNRTDAFNAFFDIQGFV